MIRHKPRGIGALVLRSSRAQNSGSPSTRGWQAQTKPAWSVDQGADLAIADRREVEVGHTLRPQPLRRPPERDIEPVAGGGLARRTDQDAEPAQFRGGLEAMLVGQVVAHEHRTRSPEFGFRHEGAQGVALGRAGRAQLDHHIAALDRPAALGGEIIHEVAGPLRLVRRQPVMERDPRRLLLDQQAVGAVGEALHPVAHVVEADRHAQRQRGAVGESQLETVRSRKGDPGQRHVAFEVGERAAADDGEPAAEPAAQAIEQRARARGETRIESGVSASSTRVPSKSRNRAAPSSRSGGGDWSRAMEARWPFLRQISSRDESLARFLSAEMAVSAGRMGKATRFEGAAALGVAVRPMRDEEDLPFAAALYASTRAEEVAQTGWPAEVQQAFLAQQHEAQHQFYRAQYDGAEWLIVERDGVAIGRLYLVEWTREFRVIDIALVPEARGGGIGGALLADIMGAAAAAGKAVSAHVERNNPALRLYARLGFGLAEDKGVYLLLEWRAPERD